MCFRRKKINKKEGHKADRKEGMIEEEKKDTSHAFNEKHALIIRECKKGCYV